jgi:uncharacterized protein YdgA (DUF945 family)
LLKLFGDRRPEIDSERAWTGPLSFNQKGERMNRLFIVVAVLTLLAAVLFTGATYWLGLQAEHRYREYLAQRPLFGHVRLADNGFDRGFFSSTAVNTVTVQDAGHRRHVDGAGKDKKPVAFTLVHKIDHGPWPFWGSLGGNIPLKPLLAVVETQIELSPATRTNLEDRFGEAPDFAGTTFFTSLPLVGNGETQWVIPSLKTSGVNGETLEWEGLSAKMMFTPDLKAFKGSLTSPGLNLKWKSGRFEVTSVTSQFDIHEGIRGLYLGKASLSLARVSILYTGGEKTEFSADRVELTTSSQTSSDALDWSVAARAGQITTQGSSYGPGSYQMELRHIDAETLEKLQNVLEKLRAEFPRRPPEEISQMMLATFAQMLPELMKRSPEIEINEISFKAPDGEFLGKAKVVVDGNHAAAFSNPLFLINAITAHAEFTATDQLLQRMFEFVYEKEMVAGKKRQKPGALSDQEIKKLAVTKSQDRLKNLVDQEILIHENGDFRARADYGQGVLMLNGRPLGARDFME